MKLDNTYIGEAVRIRRKYVNSLNNILKEEDSLKQKKSEIEKIKDSMGTLIEGDLHDVTKRLKLNEHLIKIEKIIKDIQDKIRPHHKSIENLRKDAIKLYTSIKEKYPNISEDEIKEQITPYIHFSK